MVQAMTATFGALAASKFASAASPRAGVVNVDAT